MGSLQDIPKIILGPLYPIVNDLQNFVIGGLLDIVIDTFAKIPNFYLP